MILSESLVQTPLEIHYWIKKFKEINHNFCKLQLLGIGELLNFA